MIRERESWAAAKPGTPETAAIQLSSRTPSETVAIEQTIARERVER
jgi:hypothetical protein